eukprot:6468316-Amphidinium_carterae.1
MAPDRNRGAAHLPPNATLKIVKYATPLFPPKHFKLNFNNHSVSSQHNTICTALGPPEPPQKTEHPKTRRNKSLKKE